MTKEEVILSLGIDSSSLSSQLMTAEQKIDLWAKNQTTRFSAAFRNKDPLAGHGLTGINDPEQKRLADVEEASRRNQARRLLRVREENSAKQVAHLEELARKKIEDAASENSFKKRMAFIKLATKLGGAMAILNAPAIAEQVVESTTDTFKWIGRKATEAIELAMGTGLDTHKAVEAYDRMQSSNTEKAREEIKARAEAEKKAMQDVEEYYRNLRNQRNEQGNSIIDENERRKEEAAKANIRKQFSDEEWLANKKRELDMAEQRFEKTIFKDKLDRAEAEKNILDIKDDILATEKLISDELQKQFELNRTPKEALTVLQGRTPGNEQFTNVDELSGLWGSQFQDEAQKIKQLERFAKYNRSGFRDSDLDLGMRQEDEALRIRKELVDAGAIAEDEAVKNLRGILEEIQAGIVVKGAN